MSRWSDFRPDYARACRLRYILPSDVKFYATSATLPEMDLEEVRKHLKIATDPGRSTLIHRSNDRSNVAIGVRKLRHTQKSKHDLAFLIPPQMTVASSPPQSFMVFFQTKKETQDAWAYLRSRLPAELHEKVAYVHAGLTLEHRIQCLEGLRNGTIWGILCTDAAGMVRCGSVHSLASTETHRIIATPQGIDIPNIDIVIQYKVPKDLCSLAQRFGRAARDLARNGKAVLFAEPSFFAEEQQQQKPPVVKEKMEQRETPPSTQMKQEQGKRKPAHDPETSPRSTPTRKRIRTDLTQHSHPTQSAAIPDAPQVISDSNGPPARSGSVSSNSSSESNEESSEGEGDTQQRHGDMNAFPTDITPAPGPESSIAGNPEGTDHKKRKGPGSRKAKALTRNEEYSQSTMCELINAEKSVRCRRKVLNAFFKNDIAAGTLSWPECVPRG